MQRLLVAILAAVDAAIAAAVGLVVLLAPLTMLWTLAFGVTAEWGALWPVTGTLWQFGHGVPIDIAIPDAVVAAVGIAPEAANFTLSLTPLAFFIFTLLFAARSGTRAARSGAWMLGVISGAVAFTLVAVAVAYTAQADIAQVPFGLAILLPSSVYLVGALCGAIRYAWREGDNGLIDRVHDVVDSWGDWGVVPAEIVRGATVVVVGLTGVAGLVVALTVALRGGEVVALFEAARVDATGVTVLTLGHLAYLPTLLVWALAWIAGPGFSVGAGTAVSPAGTQLGVVPGIPIFGLLPENSSIWMLIVVLLPVAAGAFAGWMVRSKLVWEDVARGLAPRVAIAAGIALLTAGVIALAAVLASGSIGPGRLADTGPHVGWMTLAIGLEVLIGAGIMLLAPRHRDELAEERTDRWATEMGTSVATDADTAADASSAWPAQATEPTDETETQPLSEHGFFGGGSTPTPR
ncbi:cell division protein PerM [Microbacterium sp. A93]|uniref:cell division protein PerM n=1 Tax=Microbacterium sp. A93 TaxID=3450716 RepID=UPI003F441C20